MRKLLLLVNLVFLLGCVSNKPPTEHLKVEMQDVIRIIKEKPDWLNEKEICLSELVPKFEKEIKYLDEGCENNPRKCLENCKNEDGNACYALALLIQKQSNIENEISNNLFTKPCKLGIMSGCTNRAAFKLELKKNLETKAKCVADTFEKTCQMNDPWGCSMYGTVLAYGFGREQNIKDAIQYLDKACKKFGNDDEACKGALEVKQQIIEFDKNKPKK